jgi:hypothetical protein
MTGEMSEAKAVQAITRLRDVAEAGARRNALDWALAVLGDDPKADAAWGLDDYQPVPGDPLATIQVRLLRECHSAITAEEIGAWAAEARGTAWSEALADVVASLTGRDGDEVFMEANEQVSEEIGPPPPWVRGAG